MNDYMKDIETICGIVDIPVPRLTLDQVVLKRLLDDIATKLLTYDPTAPSTGDATVTDVRAGKTFSNAAAVGLTGTMAPSTGDATVADVRPGKTFSNAVSVGLTGAMEFTPLPAPSAMLVADDARIHFPMAGQFSDYFDVITVYAADDTELGDATFEDGTGFFYDISALIVEAGTVSLTAKMIAKDTLTLSDSAAAELSFDVFSVTHELTGCEDSNTAALIIERAELAGTLSLLAGFTALPAAIAVTVGGTPLTLGDDFSYDPGTGAYNVQSGKATGAVVITAVATE